MRHVAMFVGIERDGEGHQIDAQLRASALRALRETAAKNFGGYTISNAAGGWINPEGKLIEEGSVRLDLYTDKHPAEVVSWAGDVARSFKQQSVLLDDAGHVTFVSGVENATLH